MNQTSYEDQVKLLREVFFCELINKEEKQIDIQKAKDILNDAGFKDIKIDQDMLKIIFGTTHLNRQSD